MRTNSSRWGWGGGGGIEWGELSKGREGGPPSTCLPCHYQLSHKPTCGERSKFDWVLFTPRKGIWSQNKIRNKSYYIYLMCVLFLFAAESNIQLYHRGITSTTQTFRQHEFIKYEFHCLDVPRVGAIAVSDAFDCTFECLSNLLCFSVNLAASKGVHGKLWCELLSSDRHRNSTEFKRNESSHHFAIKVRDTETNHFISFVLLLWSWMICINVTTITVIIIINILNIVIIDIWKSVL